jgi:hypothetical protein
MGCAGAVPDRAGSLTGMTSLGWASSTSRDRWRGARRGMSHPSHAWSARGSSARAYPVARPRTKSVIAEATRGWRRTRPITLRILQELVPTACPGTRVSAAGWRGACKGAASTAGPHALDGTRGECTQSALLVHRGKRCDNGPRDDEGERDPAEHEDVSRALLAGRWGRSRMALRTWSRSLGIGIRGLHVGRQRDILQGQQQVCRRGRPRRGNTPCLRTGVSIFAAGGCRRASAPVEARRR